MSRRKIFIVAALGVGAVVAALPLFWPVLAIPAQDAPPARAELEEPDWKAGFDRVYRLEPGRVVKRVPPPFVPQRTAMCVANHHLQGKDAPTYMLLHGTPGGEVRGWGFAYGGDGKLPLKQVLSFAFDLRGHQFEGPDDLLALDLIGDWVLDPDAPLPAQLAAVTGIIREAHGRLVRFERRQLEREVIVAGGRFAFSPLPELREPKLLHLFTGTIDPARGGQKTGSLAEFFQTLEAYAGQPVIDETAGGAPAEFLWVAQNSAYLADKPRGPERERSRRELLDHVARQTGLTFKVVRRPVPVWVVVEGPAAG